LIEFDYHAAERRKRRGQGKPETFNFLGFTHFCGKSPILRTSACVAWRWQSVCGLRRKPSKRAFRATCTAIRPSSGAGCSGWFAATSTITRCLAITRCLVSHSGGRHLGARASVSQLAGPDELGALCAERWTVGSASPYQSSLFVCALLRHTPDVRADLAGR